MLHTINLEIIEEFRGRISRLGLESILDIELIENTFKTRRKYGKYKDGKQKFADLMWEINKPNE